MKRQQFQTFQEFSLQAKVVVLGDPKTGKSSLIQNFDPRSRAGHFGNTGVINDEIIFSVVEFPVAELAETVANDNKLQDVLQISDSKTSRSSMLLPNSSVFLKIWEYSLGVSREDEQLAFRGSLFCIITIDLRSPETAKNAFEKWLVLKEKHMSESFLFVVGTFLDYSIQRRVEIADVCKSCAQKEAIYLEVSNFDGSNIHLLRRLIAQRINYMIRVRELISLSTDSEMEKKDSVDNEESFDEAKYFEHEKALASSDGALATPFLEQDIVCDSIGSILASCLGAEVWPGYESEEISLKRIGSQLTGFVDRITTEQKILPKGPIEHSLDASDDFLLNSRIGGGGVSPSSAGIDGHHGSYEAIDSVAEPDIEELRHVFEIMGFDLPASLLASGSTSSWDFSAGRIHDSSALSSQKNGAPASAIKSSPQGDPVSKPGLPSSSTKSQGAKTSTKLRVRLPDGSPAAMTLYPGYGAEEQVDAFMVQHGMEVDGLARGKLIEAARATLARMVVSTDRGAGVSVSSISHGIDAADTKPPPSTPATHATPTPSSAPNPSKKSKQVRKCRIRIQLPDSSIGAIETVVREGEDLVALSKRISMEYKLSSGFQQRVYDQLRAAFK